MRKRHAHLRDRGRDACRPGEPAGVRNTSDAAFGCARSASAPSVDPGRAIVRQWNPTYAIQAAAKVLSCRRADAAAARSCPLACMPAHPALDIEEFSDFVSPSPGRSGRVDRLVGSDVVVGHVVGSRSH
jgi:hypothetical protein